MKKNNSFKKNLNKYNNKIIAILGPTSSGKSDFAVSLAKKINENKEKLDINGAEIISADSRQIYKGFNLSSGKITEEEMHGIQHYMLDIASPKKTYTIIQYKKRAEKIIKRLHKINKIPIICGGSVFWIYSLLYDYNFPNVPPNKKFRDKMNKLETEKLYEILKNKDAKRANKIDRNNKRRIIRALEIINNIGKVPELKFNLNKYKILKIGININKEILIKKIKKRLEDRIKNGLIEEIKNVNRNGVSHKRLQNFGLEFKWVSLYLQNKIDKNNMVKKLFTDITHYAKRQMTWLKKDKDIIWIKNPNNINSTWDTIISFLNK